VSTDILPFLNGRAFDEEETRLMSAAFDKARALMHDGGQPALVEELLAKRIIMLAAEGERHVERLARQALERLGMPLRDD